MGLLLLFSLLVCFGSGICGLLWGKCMGWMGWMGRIEWDGIVWITEWIVGILWILWILWILRMETCKSRGYERLLFCLQGVFFVHYSVSFHFHFHFNTGSTGLLFFFSLSSVT